MAQRTGGLINNNNNKNNNYKIYSRIRPIEYPQKMIEVLSDQTLTIKDPAQKASEKQQFAFDGVFDGQSKQETVWSHSTEPVLQKLVEGHNGIVLSYGQTGAGKSFTVFGEDERYSINDMHMYSEGGRDKRGLVPRTVEFLFKKGEELDDIRQFVITVSIAEVYLDQVRDLGLAYVQQNEVKSKQSTQYQGKNAVSVYENQNLMIKESTNGQIIVQDLSQITLNNMNDLYDLLQSAFMLREKCENKGNQIWARAHTIFTINLVQKDKENDMIPFLNSSIQFVDLAGSERIAKSLTEGHKFQEAILISSYLASLQKCLQMVAKSSKSVPYRETKLTKIIQNCMTYSSHTILFLNLNPTESNFEECLSSLQYGERTRNSTLGLKQNSQMERQSVTEEFVMNVGGGYPGSDKMVKKLQEEISELKSKAEYIQKEHKEKLNSIQELLGIDIDLDKVLSKASQKELYQFKLQKQALEKLENVQLQNEDLKAKIEKLKSLLKEQKYEERKREEENTRIKLEQSEIIKQMKDKLSQCKLQKDTELQKLNIEREKEMKEMIERSNQLLEEKANMILNLPQDLEKKTQENAKLQEVKKATQFELEKQYKSQIDNIKSEYEKLLNNTKEQIIYNIENGKYSGGIRSFNIPTRDKPHQPNRTQHKNLFKILDQNHLMSSQKQIFGKTDLKKTLGSALNEKADQNNNYNINNNIQGSNVYNQSLKKTGKLQNQQNNEEGQVKEIYDKTEDLIDLQVNLDKIVSNKEVDQFINLKVYTERIKNSLREALLREKEYKKRVDQFEQINNTVDIQAVLKERDEYKQKYQQEIKKHNQTRIAIESQKRLISAKFSTQYRNTQKNNNLPIVSNNSQIQIGMGGTGLARPNTVGGDYKKSKKRLKSRKNHKMFGNTGGGGLFGGGNTQQQGGGLFGGNNQQQQQQAGGMGNNMNQQGGGLFGGGATQQQQGNTGLFGGGNTQQQQGGGGLFGGANTNPMGGMGGNQQGNTGLFGGGSTTNTQQQGGFMTNQNTSLGGGGLFGGGSTTTNQTGGGLFGTNQNTGQNQQTGGGLFGGGGGFGQNNNQQQQGGLMGQNNQNQTGGMGGMFGNTGQNTGGGGLFGGGGGVNTQQQGGGGLFGGNQNQQQQNTMGGGGGLFGGGGNTQNTGMGGGLFGGGGNTQQQQQQGGGLFGGAQNQQQGGNMMGGGSSSGYQRMQGYKPYQSSNTNLIKGNVVPYINCISAHPQFNNNYCTNEIRLLDYMDIKAGKLNPNQLGQMNTNTQQGGMFGGGQQQQQNTMGGGLFGGGGATQNTNTGLFGGGGGLNTQNQTQQQQGGGGLFGPGQNAGANSTTNTGGGLFGGGGGAFNNQNKTGGGLFGGGGATNTQNQTGGGLFGGNTNNNTQNTNTGGGLFGGGGATLNTNTGGGLFGGGVQQNTQQQQNTGGGLFGGGAQQNTGGGLFGGGAVSNTNTGGGLFGGGAAAQNTNTGGGLFGGGAAQNQQQQQGINQNNQQVQPGAYADQSQIIKQLTELVSTIKLQQQPQNPRMGPGAFQGYNSYEENYQDRREPNYDDYGLNQYQRFGYGEGRDEAKLFTSDRLRDANKSSIFSSHVRQSLDPYSSQSLISKSQRQQTNFNSSFEPQNNLLQQKRETFFKSSKSNFKDLSAFRQNDFDKLKKEKIQKLTQEQNYFKKKTNQNPRQSLNQLNQSAIKQREFLQSQLNQSINSQQNQDYDNVSNISMNSSRAHQILGQDQLILRAQMTYPIKKVYEIHLKPQDKHKNFAQILDQIKYDLVSQDQDVRNAIIQEGNQISNDEDDWFQPEDYFQDPILIIETPQKDKVVQPSEKIKNFIPYFSQKGSILKIIEQQQQLDDSQQEQYYQNSQEQDLDQNTYDQLSNSQQGQNNILLGHFELIQPANLNEIEDLSCIRNLTIKDKYVQIQWLEELDLSQGINFEEAVKDNQNEIIIEDPRLNKKASIVFFNFCKNLLDEVSDITLDDLKENSLIFSQEIGIKQDEGKPEFDPKNNQWTFYGIVDKFFDESDDEQEFEQIQNY
ncbi:P-loop containing nucleoside triphosphate hydrolase [Pseudocohnilembus persalinus]|uniref:p-loop containing nucleoside triphosphate hydrolase n=1 Tax=Pseudocohnilembus persalinus TaxID=266149 RepID=A0A0V0QFE8_PSEPJ|nr:P-loop containing nucleoside triphosphate hydrolase [Pseudocohnilembus persalinus]|eukprot:KRX00930.1 P-loop containing nucleoside triphosphate hydrolase [Pseudocohnilembus persalinus]